MSHPGWSTKMWQKDPNVVPDVGAHAERYTDLLRKALDEKRKRVPYIPRNASERARIFMDLAGAMDVLSTDIVTGSGLQRVLSSTFRVVHEALVFLGRLHMNSRQVNAVLAAVLDDEMARVDPERGLLGENDGKPYIQHGGVADPPGFMGVWSRGSTKIIRGLRSAKCPLEPDIEEIDQ